MKLSLSIFFFLSYSVAFGQDSLTLQHCLDKALANKVLYSSQLSFFQSSEIERRFHTWSLLPNLNAYTGVNTSFGRRLDPFTNTFASTNVNSQSFGLNSSMQIYNGLNYIHRKNILDATIQKNELSLEAKQNEVRIQVIELYIALCKLSKQVDYAKIRLKKYQQIQQIQLLLIEEGRISAIDTLKSHNSLMNENGLLINLQGDITLKLIDLNYLIGDSLMTNHIVLLNSVSSITDKPKLSQQYAISQLEIDQEIAENQLNIERSNILPNLSLNGLLGTGFSTNNKDYTIPGNPTKPYHDQVSQNLYEGIGLYLSVPIFNRGSFVKSKQIYAVKNTERETAKEQISILIEKQKIELEQKRIKNKAEQEQVKQIVDNLQAIYDKTVILYREGRTTYTELDIAFMDWQTKLVFLESLKLDTELLSLYE